MSSLHLILAFLVVVGLSTQHAKLWEETKGYLDQHSTAQFIKDQIKIKPEVIKYDPFFTTAPSDKILAPKAVERDTLAVALDFLHRNPGKTVMVVNFAHNFTPGGLYQAGAPTQEADLFRRTTLSLILDNEKARKQYYPINLHGSTIRAIYAGGVRILRGEGGFIDPAMTNVVDVCSIAAYNSTSPGDAQYYGNGMDMSGPRILNAIGAALTRQKIELMFQMALKKGANLLILGAFGCGTAGNIPEQMVDLFNETLYKYRLANLEVVFAVTGEPASRIFKANIATNLTTNPLPVFRIDQAGGMKTFIPDLPAPPSIPSDPLVRPRNIPLQWQWSWTNVGLWIALILVIGVLIGAIVYYRHTSK